MRIRRVELELPEYWWFFLLGVGLVVCGVIGWFVDPSGVTAHEHFLISGLAAIAIGEIERRRR